jgi:Opacity family porin protein
MNPTTNSNSYLKNVNNKIADIDTNTFISPAAPTDVNTYFKSTDFQARFGIGYVAGFSYDFHTNLYFDCRVTKNAWDNSTSVSAIEMSNKFFRVASIQLGIGYRFNEKERTR